MEFGWCVKDNVFYLEEEGGFCDVEVGFERVFVWSNFIYWVEC